MYIYIYIYIYIYTQTQTHIYKYIYIYIYIYKYRESAGRFSRETVFNTLKQSGINILTIDYSISWRVLSSSSPYNGSSKRCNLCLKEKFRIIYRPDLSSLNKRNELVSSCRHRNKALLRNS